MLIFKTINMHYFWIFYEYNQLAKIKLNLHCIILFQKIKINL